MASYSLLMPSIEPPRRSRFGMDGLCTLAATRDWGPFVGAATAAVDLKGRFLMPGLIDGHMHPLEAGMHLLKCSVNYESLTVAELQQRVQACLDRATSKDPDSWLEVVSWFQESMRPAGVKTSRATLDVLKTTRPIIVRSSFGHTVLASPRVSSKMLLFTRCSPNSCRNRLQRSIERARWLHSKP